MTTIKKGFTTFATESICSRFFCVLPRPDNNNNNCNNCQFNCISNLSSLFTKCMFAYVCLRERERVYCVCKCVNTVRIKNSDKLNLGKIAFVVIF